MRQAISRPRPTRSRTITSYDVRRAWDGSLRPRCTDADPRSGDHRLTFLCSSYTYDLAGNLKTETDALGNITSYLTTMTWAG